MSWEDQEIYGAPEIPCKECGHDLIMHAPLIMGGAAIFCADCPNERCQ